MQFHELRAEKQAGRSIEDLQKMGYAAATLRWAGHTITELRPHYEASEVHHAGFSQADMLLAGYTLSDLTRANCPKDTLPVDLLLQFGYTLEHLHAAGCKAAQLKERGFTAIELWRNGYTALELRWGGCVGCFTAAELKDAGFIVADLREICTGFELIAAGFTQEEVTIPVRPSAEFTQEEVTIPVKGEVTHPVRPLADTDIEMESDLESESVDFDDDEDL